VITGGGLLTHYFLTDGIRRTEAYRALDKEEVDAVRIRLVQHWRRLARTPSPSEPETEAEFIYPVLKELGWEWLVQPIADRRRRDVADALLFLTPAAKNLARPLPPLGRFVHGTVIAENEARHTTLDRAGAREAPASQILRTMSRAKLQSNGMLRWGLLTNGGTWRLYFGRARSTSAGFVGVNLAGLLEPPPLAPVAPPEGAPPDHWMRVFLLLFRREAFEAAGPGGATFLDSAIEEGRAYEARVTEELSAKVFDRVFPMLVQAFVAHDPDAVVTSAEWKAAAREGAIRLLYRLLFLLYAEDRDLLPVHHPRYVGYSLRELRREAAEILDSGVALATRATQQWDRLRDLIQAVANGDARLGLPAYHGDLFEDRPGDILSRVRLPDAELVPIIDDMSREMQPGVGLRWINYRDLSVQHLGSIYERLLEHDVVEASVTSVTLRPSPYARKATGSFYTREELVRLILRRAVDPLIVERRDAFTALSAADVTSEGATLTEVSALETRDPAEAILRLRICDPAMGSGAFLVSLIDHLTDAILETMADANDTSPGGLYRSPVAARIVAIRDHIRASADANGWTVQESGLDDRHIVRRMVLKRCIFGVDLNPMAVELAKLSLWLHSFTVGAPLSFLDHHLRCGDSLFGEFVGKAVTRLQDEYGLSLSQAVVSAQAAAAGMADIEASADADIAEVHASRDAFERVELATAPLRTFLSLYHASRWIPPDGDVEKVGRQLFFGGSYGDPVEIANGGAMRIPTDAINVRPATRTRPAITAREAFDAASTFVARSRAVIAEGRFLHWEAAFPGVWDGWETAMPRGGFDAVIGNPPWDRIKMQEVEWWAARREDIASISRAVDRKAGIAALRRAGDPLAAIYDRAAARAKRAAEVAAFLPRQKADGTLVGPYPLYPLFAKGDVNVYTLFVERAGQLVQPDGIVGLLVPSGVAADKGAATFFRSISNTGRLGTLLDFENRRPLFGLEPFFPSVDSRFKFSALVHGGNLRRYAQAQCAFFQQDTEAAERNAFGIRPEDFARVNANTGTAPVFRAPRDAQIVLGIYGRLPVLVDRRTDPPRALYPVAYGTQLHMTNDSGLFRSAEELEADGAYPVAGGAYERGNSRFLPLMVGRSVHLFDHRFASVMEDDAEDVEAGEATEVEAEAVTRRPARRPTRSRNVHNPYSSRLTTGEEYENPAFNPRPRYWVAETKLEERWPEGLEWAVAFRDIARPTDVRTVISCVVPRAAFGNKLPLLLPALPDPPRANRRTAEAMMAWRTACLPIVAEYKESASLLAGNLGVLVLDYVARNKVQSTSLNLFILEQLPLVPREGFTQRFGRCSAEDIVREEVLALSYTAHDLAPFARDQGYDGQPFVWNTEDRLRRRARLNAVFMLLYGLDRTIADYILNTFPILKRQEENIYGHYRTRNLILHYMAAMEAGNPDAQATG